MKNVAVLGCGPQGLLIAWAVAIAGHKPNIISKKVKSEIPGSQHLHGAIPGITSPYPEGTIQFVRLGTEEGYAEKVYGDASRTTGWENYLQVFPSWNVLHAYDKLWGIFGDEITDHQVDPYDWDLVEIQNGHDLVISTLPAKALCINEAHQFNGVPYWIMTLPTPEADRGHEIVVYNGMPSDPWYRWSILGGLCSMEYTQPPPPQPVPPHGFLEDYHTNEVIQGTKAVSNDCTCWPKIHRLGRWSEWRHGVTMHNAFIRARQLLEDNL